MIPHPYSYKSLDETVWEMLALWWSRTGIRPDVEPGGVLRTLCEAVGFEVEDLTFRFDQGLASAIPIAIFEAFGFEPLTATKASVPITFTRSVGFSGPLEIPAGFKVGRADGVDYEVVLGGEIPVGESSVTLMALCTTPGTIGNTSANTVIFPRASLPTLVSVTNPQPAEGGQDAESLDDQKRRFARYIASVHRATRQALAAAAMTVVTSSGERAREVLVLDAVYKPDELLPGYIEVWVDDGFGSASSVLCGQVRHELEHYRAAGTVLVVRAVTAHAVDIVFRLDGEVNDLEPCREAARRYIRELRIGEKVSRENLITALTNAAANSYEVTLLEPEADVSIGQTERATIGELDGRMVD